jgi:hypothetical protein
MPNYEQILTKSRKIHQLLQNVDTTSMPLGYRDNLLGIFSINNPLLFQSFGCLTQYTTLPTGTSIKLPSAPKHERIECGILGDIPSQVFIIKAKLLRERAKIHPILRFLASKVAI